MKSTKKKIRKVKIINLPDFVLEQFKIKLDDKFEVVRSQLNEDTPAKVGHLIYTKNKRAIVVYSDEVEVL